jgi:hypothetical protein
LEWQNIYVYDFNKQAFRTDLAAVPTWPQPMPPVDPHLFVLFGALLIALITYLRLGERKHELAANLTLTNGRLVCQKFFHSVDHFRRSIHDFFR